MICLGLWLYGFLAHDCHRPKSVDKEAFLTQFNAIKADDLKAVFRYFDGKSNDDALTHQIAKEAKEAGAVILEHKG